ncbi:MAG: hypothetical protein WKF36_03085, partial [Candidatus Nitrosocosmicus sp.]
LYCLLRLAVSCSIRIGLLCSLLADNTIRFSYNNEITNPSNVQINSFIVYVDMCQANYGNPSFWNMVAYSLP